MISFINREILKQAKNIQYTIAENAPNTEKELFGSCGGLVIWSGASENTIYCDPQVNFAFRALHDTMHLETGLDFSVEQEIELGRIQAAKQSSDLLADLIYAEIAGQAEVYKETGAFVENQLDFMLEGLKKYATY